MREIKFRAWDGEEMTDWDEFDGGDMTLEQFFAPDVPVWNVMQFTGLKDKNGKEIYERDVVKGNEHFIEQVHFKNGCWYTSEDSSTMKVKLFDWDDIEIIGNIYENPELLTSK